jgi:hypothetical protein
LIRHQLREIGALTKRLRPLSSAWAFSPAKLMLRLGRTETRHVREVGAVPQTGRRLATRTPVLSRGPVAGRPVAVPTAHERLNHQCRMPRAIAPRLLSSLVLRQGHVAEKHQGIPSAPRPSGASPKTKNGWRPIETSSFPTERPPTGGSAMGSQKMLPNQRSAAMIDNGLTRQPCPIPGARDHPVPC